MLLLKVCGMSDEKNISDLIKIQPDFIGLIFHEKSPRNVTKIIDVNCPENINLTGVFVEESENFIMKKVSEYNLMAIQLHGYESPKFCKKMQEKGLIIIKAFNIHEAFDFKNTEPYEGLCDYFLFDAFGKKAGGNGTTFKWEMLNDYKGSTPFFLSGGIDDSMGKSIKKNKHPQFIGADINSKFESAYAYKNIKKVKQFSDELRG
ncbi:MAG: phosphoribosylanthranilate isomerase [Flavobacteriales bacterium]|nr:phosphoribosylanthranilate isomerase [Flavobacteriales bacterium]